MDPILDRPLVAPDAIAPDAMLPRPIKLYALSVVSLLFCLALSTYFFLGFYENDPQWQALLPAFVLCYGLAGLGAIPVLMTLWAAQKKRVFPKRRRYGVLILVLHAPWLVLSLILIFNSGLAWYWGVLGVIVSGSFICAGLNRLLITADQDPITVSCVE